MGNLFHRPRRHADHKPDDPQLWRELDASEWHQRSGQPVEHSLLSRPGSEAGLHQPVANYPGDNSFSGSTSNTYSFTVTKANSVIADFFPYGTPVANVPVMVGGQVALSNYCARYGSAITHTDVTSVPRSWWARVL